MVQSLTNHCFKWHDWPTIKKVTVITLPICRKLPPQPCNNVIFGAHAKMRRMGETNRSLSRSWPSSQQPAPVPDGSGTCSRARSWPLVSSPSGLERREHTPRKNRGCFLATPGCHGSSVHRQHPWIKFWLLLQSGTVFIN